MRKAALLALPLALSGCSGMGKYIRDTMVWTALDNPNGPHGESENIHRARGEKFAEAPIFPESGNIWPGAPQPLPTLKDVENPNSTFSHALGDPATYFGGAALDESFMSGIGSKGALGASGQQLMSGQSISVGESVDTHQGVSRDRSHVIPTLPSSVPDNAGHFLNKNPSKTIVIPNGDGTSTLIAPDGSVKVVHGVPAAPK
ncbi:hypothetical protein [Gluconobacter kanchanaburiensis]|uniref:Lipoprotein n=1 Tax=Gluconobacter kanchanaburiensis NBRC 103587 TaxID=1307948 RepID=A0A511BA76_9PROT|nr:hypothetical protein [Gluconobacter kanchanaburiensis]MBF0862539.1 hypothetical protein [Gluconobacter kanchanaburiensis]GEK96661.1 hypothetical protein GKA01_18580 [Gluconobacter kanchanaburiensis NBRC 103587]